MKKICLCLFLTFSCLILSSHISSAADKDNMALQGTTEEIYQEILQHIGARNFRKAEELFNNVLTSKRISIDGMRVLEEVYDKLKSFQDEPVLNEWCETSESSHFPFAIRGNYYLKKAREIRGTGLARMVKEDQWAAIKDLLQKAQADYETAYERFPADPASASSMVALANDRSYPVDVMEKWFKRAIEADNFWLSPYWSKLFYLAPWWHGSEQEMKEFLKYCYENSPQGSTVYTIILKHSKRFNNLQMIDPEMDAMVTEGIKRLHQDFPKSALPDYYEGVNYYNKLSFQDALTSFNKALEKDPKNIAALEGKAYTHMALERLDNAEVTLNELLKIESTSVFALTNLGIIQIKLHNNIENGIQMFEKAFAVDTDSHSVKVGCLSLADLLSEREKHKEAVMYYSKVLALDPFYELALLKRGSSKNSSGDSEGAIEDMLAVQQMDGKYKEEAKRLAEEFMKGSDEKKRPDNELPEPSPVEPPQAPLPEQDIQTADIKKNIQTEPLPKPDTRTIQAQADECEGFYFRRKKEQAIDCYSNLLLAAPDFSETHYMLGKIAENLEFDFAKAANYYGIAVSKDPKNEKYIMSLGQAFYMNHNYEQAIAVFTKLIELNSTNGEVYYQRGLCFDAAGKKEEAINDMQKASLYAGKEEARAYLQKNVKIEIPQVKMSREDELAGLIQQNFVYQRFDEAEKQLKELLEINPKNDMAHFQLGLVYRDRDRDHQKVLEQFNKAISLNGNYTDYLFNRAVLLEFLEKTDLAIQDYTTALSQRPKSATYYGYRAGCYIKLGEYKKAEEDLQNALKYAEGNRDYYNQQLAALSVKTGTPLKIDKENTKMLVDRGKSYSNDKEFDLAKKDFLQAVKLDPKNAAAYYELGILYFEKLRKPAEAISYYDKAINLDKGNRDYFFSRGRVYFEQKEYSKAKNDFSSALELKKDDTQIYYYRGYCNKELGLRDQAVDDLLKAKQDPGWAQAVDGLLQGMM